MGAMDCEIHGLSGFVDTCPHVAEQIAGGTMPHGRRFSILTNFLVCDDCFHSLGFEPLIDLASLSPEEIMDVIDDDRWKALETIEGKLGGRHWFCVKCVAELPQRPGDGGGG
jgi:hypothetical protein